LTGNLFYSEEDERYVADIPDLKHCSAFGTTPEKTLQEVLKAKEAWLRIFIKLLFRCFQLIFQNVLKEMMRDFLPKGMTDHRL
jgi:hypothetical protein